MSSQAAAEEIAKEHEHVDLLINVTGILHIAGKIAPGKVSPMKQARSLLLIGMWLKLH